MSPHAQRPRVPTAAHGLESHEVVPRHEEVDAAQPPTLLLRRPRAPVALRVRRRRAPPVGVPEQLVELGLRHGRAQRVAEGGEDVADGHVAPVRGVDVDAPGEVRADDGEAREGRLGGGASLVDRGDAGQVDARRLSKVKLEDRRRRYRQESVDTDRARRRGTVLRG